VVAFVDAHRGEFGVEPICTTLQVAPSTYYAARRRQVCPSARALSDAVMGRVLMALWVANRKVYGADKLWRAARRAGHDIGRDQVARLMRSAGMAGVCRRRQVVTTRPDPGAARPGDLVNREFTAKRPDALWVTDLTYVPTRAGMAYVCFIVDAFSRRIVGWRVAANMKTGMVLDALEMARRARGSRRLVGLIAHSDAGSQFTSVRFGERLAEIGARPSIGTVADSYDCPGRNDQRPLQDRVRLRARHRRLGRRRAPRAGHLGLGPLVQPRPPPQPLRTHPPRRTRSSVLRCPTHRPNRDRNPITRASNKPRAVQIAAGEGFY
jgi:putative transposase